ncbi:MAG: hypothetical protein DMF37_06265 [Verrucomicrobia bacterium]|nr:MAG: hypothetical protein DMF37_06265 [Verrucomicrobiota bacterium]
MKHRFRILCVSVKTCLTLWLSWEVSPGEKIYTFHLRHNAKRSNGDAVIAQTFVDSYHRIPSTLGMSHCV